MTDNSETIATFDVDGATYEIDHLGINFPDTQVGMFNIYRDGDELCHFIAPASWYDDNDVLHIPTGDELFDVAKLALIACFGD